jgi:4-aminobutyrate aminotransferase/(S)-3-amino-2-methylpropionate transaminase
MRWHRRNLRGSPVACAAALAAIDTLRTLDLAWAARRIGEVTLTRLLSLQAEHPGIGDVGGRGAMMAIELVRPGTLEPDPESTRRITRACHQAGVMVLSCGTFANVIRLLPPLVIDAALLDDGLGVLATAVDDVLA